jgi:hypothetical protein
MYMRAGVASSKRRINRLDFILAGFKQFSSQSWFIYRLRSLTTSRTVAKQLSELAAPVAFGPSRVQDYASIYSMLNDVLPPGIRERSR